MVIKGQSFGRAGLFVFLAILLYLTLTPLSTAGESGQIPDPVVLTVEEAMELAAEHHPGLLDAEKEVERAVRHLKKAQAALAPELTVSAVPLTLKTGGELELPAARLKSELNLPSGLTLGGDVRGSLQDDSADYHMRITVSHSLFKDPEFHPVQRRIAEAEAAVNLAEQNLNIIRGETQIAVLNQLFLQEAAERRHHEALALWEEAVKNRNEVQKKIAGGAGSHADLLLAELNLEKTDINREETGHLLENRSRELLEILGLPGTSADYEFQSVCSLPPPHPLPSEEELKHIIEEAFLASAELLAFSLRVERALAALESERENAWPEIVLRGDYERDSRINYSGDAGETDEDWSIFFEISHTLADGGWSKLNLAEKEADLKAAVYEYENKKDRIRKKVESLFEELAAAAREIRLAELKLQKADLELRQGEKLLEQGMIDLDTLNRLERDYRDAEFELRTAEHKHRITALEIHLISGNEISAASTAGGEVR